MRTHKRIARAWSLPFAALFGLALVLAGAGCDQDEATGGSSDAISAPTGAGDGGDAAFPGPFADLTLAAIDEAVGLRADQREPMRIALDKARTSHTERLGRRGEGRRGGPARGDKSGMTHGPGPMIEFLEESAEILDGPQFASLAGLLAGRVRDWAPGAGKGPRHGRGGPDGRAGPGGIFGALGERLADELDLSAEQKEKVRAVFESHREEMRAIREEARAGGPDRQDVRDRMRAIRETLREELRAVLTEEQWARWEEIRAEKIGERIEGRLERMEEQLTRRADFLVKVLDLTADQAERLQEMILGTIPARRAVLESVRPGEGGPHETFDAIREIEEALAAEISSLLTPEQREIWEALRDLIPGRGRPGR